MESVQRSAFDVLAGAAYTTDLAGRYASNRQPAPARAVFDNVEITFLSYRAPIGSQLGLRSCERQNGNSRSCVAIRFLATFPFPRFSIPWQFGGINFSVLLTPRSSHGASATL